MSSWQLVSGNLTQISVGSASHIWGVDRYTVYQRVNNAWRQEIGAVATYVSVGADSTVWGLSLQDIPHWYLAPTWHTLGGQAMNQISIGSKSHIWGVDKYYCACQLVKNTWQQIRMTPQIIQVSVGADGTVWCVSCQNIVFQYAGNGQFQQIDGKLKLISVGSASHIWGLDASNAIYQRVNNAWQRVPGSLGYISVGADGTVWGLNANNEIFVYTHHPATPTTE